MIQEFYFNRVFGLNFSYNLKNIFAIIIHLKFVTYKKVMLSSLKSQREIIEIYRTKLSTFLQCEYESKFKATGLDDVSSALSAWSGSRKLGSFGLQRRNDYL